MEFNSEPYRVYPDSDVLLDIYCRTATGKKVHKAGSPGTSVTHCGVWLKSSASRFAIKREQAIGSPHLCGSCFTPSQREAAKPVTEESLREGQIKTAILLDKRCSQLRHDIRQMAKLWEFGPKVKQKEQAVAQAYAERYPADVSEWPRGKDKLRLGTSLGLRRAALKKLTDEVWEAYFAVEDKGFDEYLKEVYADEDGITSLEDILRGAREYCGKLEASLQDREKELAA